MLLGCGAAESLGIVTFALGVHEVSITAMLQEFPGLFNGIGCLKGCEVKLHSDKTVQPVALRHHSIAFHLRPQVEPGLNKLETASVIKKVRGLRPGYA
ncbi:hypothetical protein NDU88_000648 [Pleurodeles waltl]|uniref:Uncharacterized protein n=1 Tax=Pleurodeles waltl TaxID=8319 RepID=A0AAV7U6Y0_PLEWA|nr:hypothetical protein NDU88_000648 [Pleurodeles waltl]